MEEKRPTKKIIEEETTETEASKGILEKEEKQMNETSQEELEKLERRDLDEKGFIEIIPEIIKRSVLCSFSRRSRIR